MPDSHLAFTDGGPSIADQTPGKGDERTTSLAEKVRLVPDASGPGGQLRVPPSAPKISLSFVKRKSGGSGLGAWKHSCLKPITDLSFLPVRPPSMLPGFVGLSKDAGSTRSPHVFFQGEGEHAGGDLLPAKFFATTG